MLHTTFRLARGGGACATGYRKVAKRLGGVPAYGQDTPIPLATVLDLLGLDAALWCLGSVLSEEAEDCARIARLFAADCAEGEGGAVLAIYERARPQDMRPRRAILAARRYALRLATLYDLMVASRAAAEARAAASSSAAAWSAWSSAEAAAAEAPEAAAWSAAAATWAGTRRETEEQRSWEKQRSWKAQRFRNYLEGRVDIEAIRQAVTPQAAGKETQ